MKLFLDECVDRRLARHIAEHEVKTARQMGWTSIKNGELLKRAALEVDAFVTVDRNMVFQQNLDQLPLPIIVLRARSNRLADLRLLIDELHKRLQASVEKGVVTIGES